MSSSKLYRLVKSMTKAEKRYFHRFAHQATRSSPNYWKLYEYIEQMPSWDEQLLFKSLEQEGFSKHLPVVKHQLYERILDSLHLFYQESELEEQIKRSIHQAYLLLKRSLLIEAEQRLSKCRKQIKKLGLWHLLPECQEVERLILERSYKAGRVYKEMSHWEAQYRIGLTHLEQNLPLATFRGELAQLHLSKVRPDAEVLEQLDSTLSALAASQHPNSSVDLLQSQALLAFMARRAGQAREANAKLLKVLEKMPPTLRTVPEKYLSTLYNYLIDQLQLGNEEEFRKGLRKLRSLSGQKGFRQIKNLDAKIFEWSYQLELNALAGKKSYHDMGGSLDQVEDGLRRFSQQLAKPAKAGLLHLCGLAAFHTSDPERALAFSHTIVPRAKAGSRP